MTQKIWAIGGLTLWLLFSYFLIYIKEKSGKKKKKIWTSLLNVKNYINDNNNG